MFVQHPVLGCLQALNAFQEACLAHKSVILSTAADQLSLALLLQLNFFAKAAAIAGPMLGRLYPGLSQNIAVGCLTISCAITSLSVVLKFKDNKVVDGQLLRQSGSRRLPLAQISGLWSEQLHVHSLPKQSSQAALEGQPA